MNAATNVIVGGLFLLLAVVPGAAVAEGGDRGDHYRCERTESSASYPYDCEVSRINVIEQCVMVWKDDDGDASFPTRWPGGTDSTYQMTYEVCINL